MNRGATRIEEHRRESLEIRFCVIGVICGPHPGVFELASFSGRYEALSLC
jgi:hypothetical protein